MDQLTPLLVTAQSGDRRALDEFIRATQAEAWRMTRHLVGPDDADDVTQDVYVRAWRALPAYRGESSARTWLLSIARRACADAVRRRSRNRMLSARVKAQRTLHVTSDTAARAELIDLVHTLAPDRREAFVLTQVLGCSYDEAAVIAGVPVGTIRSRVARARETLVEAMRAAEAI